MIKKTSTRRNHPFARTFNCILTVLATGFTTFQSAMASPIVIDGPGAVTVVDRSATFDSLTEYNVVADLRTYTESSLRIQSQVPVPNWNQPYSLCTPTNGGCWYANGGATQGTLVVIATTDGIAMSALQLQLFGHPGFDKLRWEAYSGGVLSGSGSLILDPAPQFFVGRTFGWSDPNGIDELWVGVFNQGGANPLINPIMIDNLQVQLLASTVPEPDSRSSSLVGAAILGFVVARRRFR